MSTRLILLGTKGGPRPTPQFRGAPAQVILIDDVPYVVDCGSGVADRLVLAGVKLPDLRHVFITHHHSDHVLDYGNLLLLAWAAGLKTRVDSWGPPPLVGMTRLAFALNQVDIEVRIADEGRPDPRPLAVAHEFAEPGLVMEDERVRVTAAIVPHGPIKPAFAYRFDTAERSIVISGDTAYSEALIELARGTDVLVHEAIYVPAIERLLARNPNAAICANTCCSGIRRRKMRAGSRPPRGSRRWCCRTSCRATTLWSPTKSGSPRPAAPTRGRSSSAAT